MKSFALSMSFTTLALIGVVTVIGMIGVVAGFNL